MCAFRVDGIARNIMSSVSGFSYLLHYNRKLECRTSFMQGSISISSLFILNEFLPIRMPIHRRFHP